jgi:quinol monooxygenase YgiN
MENVLLVNKREDPNDQESTVRPAGSKIGQRERCRQVLRDGQSLVLQEPATTAWFGIQFGPTTFGIFDAFPDESGRDAHLSGKVAEALMQKASDLLAQPPKIEKADVLADKLPQ